MVIETTDKVVHPEGKILLMNGNILECTNKAVPDPDEDTDGLSLDTTGEYLQIGRKYPKDWWDDNKRKKEKEEQDRLIKLFEKYAHALYEKRDIIYSDSRMFLCPMDTGSGIAYTGRSGLSGATIGIWLEWWDSCEKYRRDEKGQDRLITFFSGSPLSGRNFCRGIAPSGKSISVSFGPFSPVWSSFMKINSRYRDAASKYEAYSLEEVLSRLFPDYSPE